MSEEKEPTVRETEEEFAATLSKAINLDGFWRTGYDLTDRDMVREIMVILMDMECYEEHQQALIADLIKVGWGYFQISTTEVDTRPTGGWGPAFRNKSGFRKLTYKHKISTVKKFCYKIIKEDGVIDGIELNTDAITYVERAAYRTSRFNSKRWMSEHPETTHMTKSYID